MHSQIEVPSEWRRPHCALPAPVILFDGVCNLCNAWVRFIIRHDPTRIFRFSAQQSPIGQAMIAAHVRCSPQLSSAILIASDSAYTESSAVLEVCRIDSRFGLNRSAMRIDVKPEEIAV